MRVVRVGGDSEIRNEFAILVGEIVFWAEVFERDVLEKFGTVVEVDEVDGEEFVGVGHLILQVGVDRCIVH